MEHGKRQATAGKGRASPRSQAKRAGGVQYSRSPRSGKNSIAAQGASGISPQPFQPSSASGGPLSGILPSQIPLGILPAVAPPPMASGLLGAHPTHSLLGPPPPPLPPGGSVSPAQGGMMRTNPPSSQPPHKQGSTYVVDLLDLSGGISLEELTERIRSLGFPQSCDFVLQLLDRYFVSMLEGDKSASTPIARDNIIALTNIFVLRQSPSSLLHPSNQTPSSASFVSSGPSLAPAEETQLLLSIQSHMEGIPTLELRYCLLDAIFGGPAIDLKAGNGLELLNKVVSLAVSIENGSHLACVALWLQTHSSESLILAKSLYYDFCVLLPDAMAPLLHLPAVSPHMAYQMTQAFTTLHPFHIVDDDLPPEVNKDHLHPPLKMLHIVSHWVESCPLFLFPSQLLDQHNIPKLPLINSNSSIQSLDFYSSRLPLVGLIQWCIITPLSAALNIYGQKSHKDELKSPSLKSPQVTLDPFNISTNDCLEVSNVSPQPPKDVATLVSNLHANLLSLLLSGLQQSPHQLSGKHGPLVTVDDVRTIVSTLVSYREKVSSGELSRAATSSLGCWMDESVERLAQFLQILLSTGLLSMKQDELLTLSSGLPKNRLMQLVISNSRQTVKK